MAGSPRKPSTRAARWAFRSMGNSRRWSRITSASKPEHPAPVPSICGASPGPAARSIPVGAFGLVHVEAAAIERTGLVARWQELDCPGLPLDGRGEITGFGTGGGQGVEALGTVPVGQLAGHGALLNGPRTVANSPDGTGGKEPGKCAPRGGIGGGPADRLGIIVNRPGVLKVAVPGLRPRR